MQYVEILQSIIATIIMKLYPFVILFSKKLFSNKFCIMTIFFACTEIGIFLYAIPAYAMFSFKKLSKISQEHTSSSAPSKPSHEYAKVEANIPFSSSPLKKNSKTPIGEHNVIFEDGKKNLTLSMLQLEEQKSSQLSSEEPQVSSISRKSITDMMGYLEQNDIDRNTLNVMLGVFDGLPTAKHNDFGKDISRAATKKHSRKEIFDVLKRYSGIEPVPSFFQKCKNIYSRCFAVLCRQCKKCCVRRKYERNTINLQYEKQDAKNVTQSQTKCIQKITAPMPYVIPKKKDETAVIGTIFSNTHNPQVNIDMPNNVVRESKKKVTFDENIMIIAPESYFPNNNSSSNDSSNFEIKELFKSAQNSSNNSSNNNSFKLATDEEREIEERFKRIHISEGSESDNESL
jgi:hypothetical protein